MEVTNEQQEETPQLTLGDLGVAAWACSELFNFMLEGYEREDYGELSKEQMEGALNRLRTSFIKFDALASALSPKPITDEQVGWVDDQIEACELTDSEEECPEQPSEEHDEDEDWSE